MPPRVDHPLNRAPAATRLDDRRPGGELGGREGFPEEGCWGVGEGVALEEGRVDDGGEVVVVGALLDEEDG